MEPNVNTNTYYVYNENEFVRLMTQKRAMEADFHPNMIDEYNQLNKDIIPVAAEILKSGAICSIESEDSVNIIAGDDIYEVPIEPLREYMGNTFEIILGPEERKFKEKQAAEMGEDSECDGESNMLPPSTYQEDPFVSFLKQLFSPLINQQMFGNGYGGAPQFSSNTPFGSAHPYNNSNNANSVNNSYAAPQNMGVSQGNLGELASLQNQIKKLTLENQNLKTRYSQLKSTYKCNQDGNDSKNADLKKANEELQCKLNELSEKIAVQNETLTDLEFQKDCEIKKLKEDYGLEHEKNTSEIERLTKLSNALQTDSDLLKKERSKNEQLVHEIEVLNRKVKDNDNDLRDKENRINDLQKKNNEASMFVETHTADLKHKIIELQRDIDNFTTEKEKTTETIKNLKDSLSSTKEKYESQIKNLEERARTIERENETSLNEKRESSKKIEELEKRLTVYKEKEAKTNTRSTENQRNYDTLKNERDSLKTELNTMRRENEELKKKNLEFKNSNDEKENDRRRLEDSNKEYEQMAFVDSLTGAFNENAFNRDFPKCNREGMIVAHVAICGMKDINKKHGRKNGNKIISLVASTLRTKLPDEKVYRCLGDQFIVIAEGKTLNNVQGGLSEARTSLAEEDITIVYGLVHGGKFANHKEALEAAEKEMKQMKESVAPKIVEEEPPMISAMPAVNVDENNLMGTMTQQMGGGGFPTFGMFQQEPNFSTPQFTNMMPGVPNLGQPSPYQPMPNMTPLNNNYTG